MITKPSSSSYVSYDVPAAAKVDESQERPIRLDAPVYRHAWLYDHWQDYQAFKHFTKDEYEIWRKLEQKRHRSLDELEIANEPGRLDCNRADPTPSRHFIYFGERYGSLDQSTIFFKNLSKLSNLLFNSTSSEEFWLKALAIGFSDRQVNFWLLYTWFARNRIFNYDYIKWERDVKEAAKEKYKINEHDRKYVCDLPDPVDDKGYRAWKLLIELMHESFKENHLNCCKYNEFVEKEI